MAEKSEIAVDLAFDMEAAAETEQHTAPERAHTHIHTQVHMVCVCVYNCAYIQSLLCVARLCRGCAHVRCAAICLVSARVIFIYTLCRAVERR